MVDSNGLPVRLALSPGEAHEVRLAGKLLSRLKSGSSCLPTVAMMPRDQRACQDEGRVGKHPAEK